MAVVVGAVVLCHTSSRKVDSTASAMGEVGSRVVYRSCCGVGRHLGVLELENLTEKSLRVVLQVRFSRTTEGRSSYMLDAKLATHSR